jgi:glutathione S-transferase
MESRPSYRHIASDFYTHCHDLPPQIGRCQISNAEAQKWADRIDGADGRAWRLPLPSLDDEPQPLGGFGQGEEEARREAAERVIANHRNIVRFAARAGGRAGFRPASAPLSDPRATVLEASIPQVDAALRHTVHALLHGAGGGAGAPLSEGLEPPVVAAALGYLRDRISVPRDMGAPAARQLRANLNEVIQRVGAAAAVA